MEMERNHAARIAATSAEAAAIRPGDRTKTPPASSAVLAGFLVFREQTAADTKGCQRAYAEEDTLPISALLARIRRLVPKNRDPHYDEIVRSFGVGALRAPPTPMSDGELARAIAEFLKDTPSTETVATLGRRLDPSNPL
ncbi:hypothetical protein ACU4GH_11535 [Bradyrhizobium betae]